MPQFCKKPVVIEATQWFKNGNHPKDGESDTEGEVVRYYRHPDVDGQHRCEYCSRVMCVHGWIDTVQGGHIVCPGDWIITDIRVVPGAHGHHYPCKPDIFEATYEKVT